MCMLHDMMLCTTQVQSIDIAKGGVCIALCRTCNQPVTRCGHRRNRNRIEPTRSCRLTVLLILLIAVVDSLVRYLDIGYRRFALVVLPCCYQSIFTVCRVPPLQQTYYPLIAVVVATVGRSRALQLELSLFHRSCCAQ